MELIPVVTIRRERLIVSLVSHATSRRGNLRTKAEHRAGSEH